jgi:hypothetical protein
VNSLFDKICVINDTKERFLHGLKSSIDLHLDHKKLHKRKEEGLSSGRMIEESTKKGSQWEWKIETEKVRKEGVSKMAMSRRRTTKRYGLKVPVLMTEMLNCAARLQHQERVEEKKRSISKGTMTSAMEAR